jgi:hypothetical protein
MPSEMIYVALLNEGIAVWRPVAAERLPDGTFRIMAEMPDEEESGHSSQEKRFL